MNLSFRSSKCGFRCQKFMRFRPSRSRRSPEYAWLLKRSAFTHAIAGKMILLAAVDSVLRKPCTGVYCSDGLRWCQHRLPHRRSPHWPEEGTVPARKTVEGKGDKCQQGKATPTRTLRGAAKRALPTYPQTLRAKPYENAVELRG